MEPESNQKCFEKVAPDVLQVKASSRYQKAHHNDSNCETFLLHLVWNDDIYVCLSRNRIYPRGECCIMSTNNYQTVINLSSQRIKNLFLVNINCIVLKKNGIFKKRLNPERIEG